MSIRSDTELLEYLLKTLDVVELFNGDEVNFFNIDSIIDRRAVLNHIITINEEVSKLYELLGLTLDDLLEQDHEPPPPVTSPCITVYSENTKIPHCMFNNEDDATKYAISLVATNRVIPTRIDDSICAYDISKIYSNNDFATYQLFRDINKPDGWFWE